MRAAVRRHGEAQPGRGAEWRLWWAKVTVFIPALPAAILALPRCLPAAAAAAASTSPQPSAKRENVNGAFHAAEDKQRRGALSGRGRKNGSVFFFFSPHREREFLLSDHGAHKQSPEPHSPPGKSRWLCNNKSPGFEWWAERRGGGWERGGTSGIMSRNWFHLNDKC